MLFQSKKILVMISCFMFLTIFSFAQMNITYNISTIANTGENTFGTSSFSLNSNKCYNVSIGISKFLSVNHSDFINACLIDLPNLEMINFNINSFPNPFNNRINFKSTNLINTNEPISLLISTFEDGRSVLSFKITAQNLFNGYALDAQNLVAGIYIAEFKINNVSHLIKIIKVN